MYEEWAHYINAKDKYWMFVTVQKEYFEGGRQLCKERIFPSALGGPRVVAALNARLTLVMIWNYMQ